jgi:hypothetical protein
VAALAVVGDAVRSGGVLTVTGDAADVGVRDAHPAQIGDGGLGFGHSSENGGNSVRLHGHVDSSS